MATRCFFLLRLTFISVLILANLSITASNKQTALEEKLPLYLEFPLNAHGLFNKNSLLINLCDARIKNNCQAPVRDLKLSGLKVNDYFEIEPFIPGEWRFNDNHNIIFTPEESFRANQSYKIAINKNIFPKFVELKEHTLTFKTAPLLPIITEMIYLQDYGENAKKIVQTKVRFNYPVDSKSLQEKIEFIKASTIGKLPFTIKFSDDHTEFTMITDISSLGPKEDIVTVNIKEGVKPLYGGEAFYYKDLDSNKFEPIIIKPVPYEPTTGFKTLHYSHTEQVLIPSIYSYLKVEAKSALASDEKNNPQQIILISSNDLVSTDEVQNHLELFLLPIDKPGATEQKKYPWKSTAEITDDIKNNLEKVEFKPLSDISEYDNTHGFQINNLAGRYLLLNIKQGMKAKSNLVLGQNYSQILFIPAPRKELKLTSKGSVIPFFGNKELTIYSSGIDKFQIEIDKISQKNINHLVSQTSKHNSLQTPTFINDSFFNEYNISEIFTAEIEVKQQSYLPLDFAKYGKGLFIAKLSYKDEWSQVTLAEKRLVLVTDLEFFVKTDQSGLQHIFVSSISEQKPVEGAEVALIGLNGEKLAISTTDTDGHTTFHSVKDYKNEKTPTAYTVTHNDDFSFMRYNEENRRTNESSGEIRAYLFSDRGVYKPGEKSNIGIIVKATNWQDILTNIPFEIKVTNPRGVVLEKQTIHLNKEGIAEYSFQTNEDSFTGSYNINLYNSNSPNKSLSSITVNYQDFLPDRMKINANFGEEENKLWLSSKNITATVNLTNLYGTPATNRKISSYIELSSAKLEFPPLKDYIFYTENIDDLNQRLADSISNEQGNGTFNLDLEKYLPQTYKLTFFAEGFEPNSGRSVDTTKSYIVSKLPYMIGYKLNNDLKYIKPNQDCAIEFIAIDNDGEKVNASNLVLELKKINYVNKLIAGKDGSYSYQLTPKEVSISASQTNIPNSSYKYKIPTEKGGNYVIYLTDQKGAIFTKVEFSVTEEGNVLSFKDDSLILKLNKSDYKAGDKILADIIAPNAGYGLITVETDKLYNYSWFKTGSAISTQKITIPENFEGKGFINVQFMQNTAIEEIFSPSFVSATAPFTASISKHEQKIELDVPEKIKSGQELIINYRTKNPGKIIIFAVDEGILSYTNYQAPDLLDYFLNDRTLSVKTSHFTDFIPQPPGIMRMAYAMAIPSPMAETEGDFIANSLSAKLNPFKRKSQPSVVFWSSIIDSSPLTGNIKFNIPDYFNGTLKIMAVAANADSVGSNNYEVLVRSDFIISPNLPLFVSPKDEFIVPITIANNVLNSGNNTKILLNVIASNGLEILEYPKEVSISENQETTVQAKLKAKEFLGSAELTITASLRDIKSCVTATTSIRPASPNITTIKTGYEKGDKLTLQPARNLYPEFSKIQLSYSTLPLAVIAGFREYLENYPFNSTEKLISKSFVSVMLYNHKDLLDILHLEQKKMNELLSKVFQTLVERQNHDGGFKDWTNYGATDEFISVYAMHFLTESAARHLPIPNDIFYLGINYLKNMANRSINSLNSAREKAYATYILARNNQASADYIINILNYLETYQKDNWRNDLTAIYLAASYKLLKMDEEAEGILDNFKLNKPISASLITDYNYYDALIKYTQYLYIIGLHFPEKLPQIEKSIVASIAELSDDHYNTLAASYAIMASIIYTDNIKVGKDIVEIKTYDASTSIIELTSPTEGFFYQLLTSGFDKNLKNTKESMHGVELERKYLDDKNKEVSKVKLGDIVNVSYTMRSGSDSTLNNMAIIDLLPAGFELVESNNITKDDSWKPEYIDRREDRTILFGTISNYKIHYQYKIRAINKGVFSAPLPYATSLYNPNIYYTGKLGQIIVE